MNAPFLFVTCQAGMENALKAEMASACPGSRFSFSQRGLVVFKADENQPGPWPDQLYLARTQGESLGSLKLPGDRSEKRWNPNTFAEAVGTAEQFGSEQVSVFCEHWQKQWPEPIGKFDKLHWWVRDGLQPAGQFQRNITPSLASTPLSGFFSAVSGRLAEMGWLGSAFPNQNGDQGEEILDVCVLSPYQFWIGRHRVEKPQQRWPGGVLPIVATPAPVISRAYFKIREAALWAGLPLEPGTRVAEIGAAPGGSCQWLLEQDFQVVGIDPAEIDPLVAGDQRFQHIQKRGREVRRRELAGVKWLLSDANVAPKYILDTFEDLLSHPAVSPTHLVLTLKLPAVELLQDLSAWQERVASWGYPHQRLRQLIFNRQEVCLVASKEPARSESRSR